MDSLTVLGAIAVLILVAILAVFLWERVRPTVAKAADQTILDAFHLADAAIRAQETVVTNETAKLAAMTTAFQSVVSAVTAKP